MAFTQLDPPIPLEVIGKGKGLAIGMIDYGPEHNLIWVTAIDDTGEIWCAPNPKVRMQKNWTMGRSQPIYSSDHLCNGSEDRPAMRN
ncbi:MAG: hypothetical protein U1E68_08630 [Sphingomonadaceae bacterium]|jgi:hypothetical protein